MRAYFYLLPLLSIAVAPAWAQSSPFATPAPENLRVAPEAVALLDKTANYYGSLQSLKVVTRGSSTWEGETSPLNLTLYFERPHRVRGQGEADGQQSVVVADGKTIFLWDDWVNHAVKRPQNDRYTEPWRDLMDGADSFVASHFSDWLFGENWLRPLQTRKLARDIDAFEAKALAEKIVNGAPARGVQLKATRGARQQEPQVVLTQTLWFRADGRLVRAQQINDFGAKIRRQSADVVSARANLKLPAAPWALRQQSPET